MALGSPESFCPNNRGDATINDPYVDGLSVTHGTPRQHIWTFVADSTSQPICSVPFFVGQDYFCDSNEMGGNIWDGMDCPISSCCTLNSPPLGSVQGFQVQLQTISKFVSVLMRILTMRMLASNYLKCISSRQVNYTCSVYTIL